MAPDEWSRNKQDARLATASGWVADRMEVPSIFPLQLSGIQDRVRVGLGSNSRKCGIDE